MKKSMSSGDGLLDRQILGHSFKEWRMLDIGGGLVPWVQCGSRSREFVPVAVPCGNLAVNFLKTEIEFSLRLQVCPWWLCWTVMDSNLTVFIGLLVR